MLLEMCKNSRPIGHMQSIFGTHLVKRPIRGRCTMSTHTLYDTQDTPEEEVAVKMNTTLPPDNISPTRISVNWLLSSANPHPIRNQLIAQN